MWRRLAEVEVEEGGATVGSFRLLRGMKDFYRHFGSFWGQDLPTAKQRTRTFADIAVLI